MESQNAASSRSLSNRSSPVEPAQFASAALHAPSIATPVLETEPSHSHLRADWMHSLNPSPQPGVVSQVRVPQSDPLEQRDLLARSIAPGRIGVLGNPSDIYGGQVIAFAFDEWTYLEVWRSDRLIIESPAGVEHDQGADYHGPQRLVRATLNVMQRRYGLHAPGVRIRYGTSIPAGAGLAGSASVVIATVRALNSHYQLQLDQNQIAELATFVENTELNITAGPQDRYAISHGGVNYFDFEGKEYLTPEDPPGKVEPLPPIEAPWFIALTWKPAIISADVHKPLRERFLSGETEIRNQMDQIADLARQGKEALTQHDWRFLGELMDENTRLREALIPHLDRDLHAMKLARHLGALGAKLAGSGGAVLILADAQESMNAIMAQMANEFYCLQPKVVFS